MPKDHVNRFLILALLVVPVGWLLIALFLPTPGVAPIRLPTSLAGVIFLMISIFCVLGSIFGGFLSIRRSILSYRGAAALVGVGGAIGSVLFVYSTGGGIPEMICLAIFLGINYGIAAFILFKLVTPRLL